MFPYPKLFVIILKFYRNRLFFIKTLKPYETIDYIWQGQNEIGSSKVLNISRLTAETIPNTDHGEELTFSKLSPWRFCSKCLSPETHRFTSADGYTWRESLCDSSIHSVC